MNDKRPNSDLTRRELSWGDFGLFAEDDCQVPRVLVDALVARVTGEGLGCRVAVTETKGSVGGPEDSSRRVALSKDHVFLELADGDVASAQRVLTAAREQLGVAIGLCADIELG